MPTRLLCFGGVLAVAALYFAYNPISFDPNSACVGNAQILSIALQEYVQDYDESLPPMQGAPIFRAVVEPYVTQSARFYCPDTGKAYLPTAHISYQKLGAFIDSHTVVTFQDSVPHSDGQKMVAYLDGHVNFGGVEQGDPTQLCISNVRQLALALSFYTQDYDEVLPPMTTQAKFRSAISPYLNGDASLYRCPVTGATYAANLRLAGKSLTQITAQHTTVAVEDSVPHPDGLKTIAYLDGHTVHGSLGDYPTDIGNLTQIGLATAMYEQDADQTFPLMETYSQFKSEIRPYILGGSSVFTSPDTGLPYAINKSLSGESVISVASPYTTPLAKDARLNSDGTGNVLYADSHVGTEYYLVPTQLTVGPSSGNPALVWRSADGHVVIDNLSARGAPSAQFAYMHPFTSESIDVERTNSKLLDLMILMYAQANNEYLPPMDNYAAFESALAPYDGGNASVFQCPGTNLPFSLNQSLSGLSLSDISNPEGTWIFQNPVAGADGSYCTAYVDGHVAFQSSATAPPAMLPWTGKFNPLVPPLTTFYPPELNQVATISGDQRQLLWGQYELWTTTSGGAVQKERHLGPFEGWNAVALASGGQPGSRLLMRYWDGSVALLTISATGEYVGDVRLAPNPGEVPAGMVVGLDGDTRVLFAESDGSVRVWTLSSAGGVISQKLYAGSIGQTIAGIAIGRDNLVRLLWDNGDGSANIWTLASNGALASSITVANSPGWTPAQVVLDNQNDLLILWKGPDDNAQVERVKPNGSLVYLQQYAPYQ